LFAALVYKVCKDRLASTSELRDEIWSTELHLRKLKGELEKKAGTAHEDPEVRG
jgi:hypothetical protein